MNNRLLLLVLILSICLNMNLTLCQTCTCTGCTTSDAIPSYNSLYLSNAAPCDIANNYYAVVSTLNVRTSDNSIALNVRTADNDTTDTYYPSASSAQYPTIVNCYSKPSGNTGGRYAKITVIIDCWSSSNCNVNYELGIQCLFIDPCSRGTINCGTHGSCSSSTGSARCVCQGGWSGDQCEIQDKCYGINCGSHGSCNPSNGQCVCNSGYSGSTCAVGPCDNIDCGDPGFCSYSSSLNAGVCNCLFGYTGSRCEIAPCTRSPRNCGVHGRCSYDSSTDSTYCSCDRDWSGSNCDAFNPSYYETKPVTAVNDVCACRCKTNTNILLGYSSRDSKCGGGTNCETLCSTNQVWQKSSSCIPTIATNVTGTCEEALGYGSPSQQESEVVTIVVASVAGLAALIAFVSVLVYYMGRHQRRAAADAAAKQAKLKNNNCADSGIAMPSQPLPPGVYYNNSFTTPVAAGYSISGNTHQYFVPGIQMQTPPSMVPPTIQHPV